MLPRFVSLPVLANALENLVGKKEVAALDNDLAAYNGAGGDLHPANITTRAPASAPVRPNV